MSILLESSVYCIAQNNVHFCVYLVKNTIWYVADFRIWYPLQGKWQEDIFGDRLLQYLLHRHRDSRGRGRFWRIHFWLRDDYVCTHGLHFNFLLPCINTVSYIGSGPEMSEPRLQLTKTTITTTTTNMTTTMGGKAGIIGGGAIIDVDRDDNVDGEMTKMKRNTDIYPTMTSV